MQTCSLVEGAFSNIYVPDDGVDARHGAFTSDTYYRGAERLLRYGPFVDEGTLEPANGSFVI